MLSLLEARLKLRELAQNWRYWSEKISNAARALLDPCEVYVFGSDVDVLIVSDKVPKSCRERGVLKAKIEEAAGLPLYHYSATSNGIAV